MKSIGAGFTAVTLCGVLMGITVTVGAALIISGNAIVEEALSKGEL